MNIAKGYAVVEHGAIDMRTVYETRRGAIINWLIIHGQMIYASMSDAEIETIWKGYAELNDEVIVHKVLVSVEQ